MGLNLGILIGYTPLIVLDPELPFTLPETKGFPGTDGANYIFSTVLLQSLFLYWFGYLVVNCQLIIVTSI